MLKTFARPLLIATIGAFATAVAASPSAAGEPTDSRSAVVHYGDLDLTTADGAAQLGRRVMRAANAVCDTSRARRLEEVAAANSCRAAALANAEPSVQLAVNAARSGERMADNSVSIRAAH